MHFTTLKQAKLLQVLRETIHIVALLLHICLCDVRGPNMKPKK